jgi:choline dehydrogenase-like flavoprotein
MASINIIDPIQTALADRSRGWKVYGGSYAATPASITCDVCIVGSGAGAGITAELLSKAGLDVVIVEEGALKSSTHFKMQEAEAYPQLYQESAARKTKDKAINILQGRTVGGSTTVNWTSSFRTPASTLNYWQAQYGLKDYNEAALAPWFLQAEKRLNIGPWLMPPNENNELLRKGAAKLGIPSAAILRNVKGCWNLGYCGMGCPTNAKQSALVTTIPAALDMGAKLVTETSAEQFEISKDQVQVLVCVPVTSSGERISGKTLRITAKHYVVSGGAINSPALLLRSHAPDPFGLLGTRTFLHPTVVSAAHAEQRVDGHIGAPQTIYSDHFLETQALDGPIGYKLEAPPIHPVLFASTLNAFGKAHAQAMQKFLHTHALLALLRDGFHLESIGGKVQLAHDNRPVLDYPLTSFVMEGARRALLSMAEIQFAAGMKKVYPVHEMSAGFTSWADAKQAIEAFPMKPYLTRVVSAHVMGGCAMASTPERGVVRPDGVHWQLSNVSVHDGSLFPTSIGANPQLSVYGITNRLSTQLAKRLTGKDVSLAAADEPNPSLQSIAK